MRIRLDARGAAVRSGKRVLEGASIRKAIAEATDVYAQVLWRTTNAVPAAFVPATWVEDALPAGDGKTWAAVSDWAKIAEPAKEGGSVHIWDGTRPWGRPDKSRFRLGCPASVKLTGSTQETVEIQFLGFAPFVPPVDSTTLPRRAGARKVVEVVGDIGLALQVAPPAPQPASRPDHAALGQRWANALLQGRVDEVMLLSDVPFNWDGTAVKASVDDLRAGFDSVVEDKGARNLAIEEAFVVPAEEGARAFRMPILPELVYVRAVIGDEGIMIAIKPGSEPKVVGFED
jgi:hypothetical protein